MAKQLGRKPEELRVPSLPAELQHLWEWFSELFSGDVLTYTEIESWARLRGVTLLTEEAKWLKMMSTTWVKENHGR